MILLNGHIILFLFSCGNFVETYNTVLVIVKKIFNILLLHYFVML